MPTWQGDRDGVLSSCRDIAVPWEADGVHKAVTGVLFALVMMAIIITVDVLFLRNHFWARLAVNVAIVLVFVSLYFRFQRT